MSWYEAAISAVSEGLCPHGHGEISPTGWCNHCHGWWSYDRITRYVTITYTPGKPRPKVINP